MANHIKIPASLKKFHDAGACIVRHDSERKAHCHYDKKGYAETKANRTAHYNAAPRQYDPATITGLKGTKKKLTVKGKVHYRTTTPVQQPKDPAKQKKTIWDVDACATGAFPNFKPKARGAHYPYRHQWHHLIPSAALEQGLYHDEFHRKPLLCLVVGKYNINEKANIVLLPEEAQVGQIIKWPIHPNNHPHYNDYAKAKLKQARDSLASALDKSKGDVHKVDKKMAENAGKDIDKISSRLYDQLEQWGRAKGAGVEINLIG